MDPSRLQIKLLGAPEISRDGTPVVFDTRKAIGLLAYLVVTGRAHRRDALAALLWPEYEGTRARAALRRTLSTLRRGLGEGFLEVDRAAASLPAGVGSDVASFRSLLDEVEAHDHGPGPCSVCMPRLQEAVGLYRGDLLSGFALRDSADFDGWQSFEAETLRRRAAGALGLLAHWCIELGRTREAIAHARRWVAMDPLHEPAHRSLMMAFWRAGDRAAAVRQYRDCVRILAEELGVEPLSETTALYGAIAAGSAQLPAEAEETAAPSARATPASFPFVGRDEQLGAVVAAHAAAASGYVLGIEGEAGVGKSRLVSELLRRIPAAVPCIQVVAHPGESDLAYAIVAEALRGALRLVDPDAVEPRVRSEIARLLPEAHRRGDPPVPGLDQPGATTAFYEAIGSLIASALRGGGTGVVVFDDLQWADEASLEAISFLARRVARLRSLLVLVWRREELGPVARLPILIADLRRDRLAREIRLERLDDTSVFELARGAGVEDPAVARRLYEETEGLPFFVVEYIDSALRAEGGDMPVGVRDLLTTRLGRTSEPGRQALTAAAVLGGPFDQDLLRDVSGRSEEEIMGALEELTASGLLRFAGDGDTFTFGHDKMRELVYEGTGLPRRRLLHRRAAVAIRSRMRGAGLDPASATLARHLREAGEDQRAAEAYKAAGDHARSLFANEDALRLYEAALALESELAADVHEAIGDVQTFMGAYSDAVMNYEQAASAEPASAELETKIAEVHQRAGRWDLAEMHHQIALEAVPPGDVGMRSRIAADRSLTAKRRGDLSGARSLTEEALALAREGSDIRALARVRNMLGLIDLAEGDVYGAIAQLRESLAAAEQIGDLSARIAASNNLASAYRARGEPERALSHATAALDLCSQLGDRHREAALHSNIADLLHGLGRRDEAIVHLKEAAALFTTVGEPTVEPEIWKLVEW